MKGYVQVYTGDGKGKTTAALGLALRAAGAGLKVFIVQFLKGTDCGELRALERYRDDITIRQYGRPCFIEAAPAPEDLQAARQGLEAAREALAGGQYDIVILDEANIATHLGLFPVEELLALIDARPPAVELVLTGRHADARLLDRADLVTEMREIKHYYNQGVAARPGTEK